MNQVVSTLDRHQAATKQSITDVEHRISTGNEAILDAHQTTAGQVDSIATANAATRGQLDSLDRLRDVPITEEVTTLHDLLADQLVQNDKGRWWIHEVSVYPTLLAIPGVFADHATNRTLGRKSTSSAASAVQSKASLDIRPA